MTPRKYRIVPAWLEGRPGFTYEISEDNRPWVKNPDFWINKGSVKTVIDMLERNRKEKEKYLKTPPEIYLPNTSPGG